MSPKKLSIVIPVFNKWNFTGSALNDLAYLDTNLHEIIVVDNNSTDETHEKIKTLKLSNLTYIRLSENMGFGYACNQGYAASKTPLVMFLNNDIRVSSHLPSWTDVYIEELTHKPEELLSPTGGYIDSKREFQFLYETEGDKKFNYLSGWMLVSSRQCFDKFVESPNVGPFRADKYFAYFEDSHLGFRAAELNIPMRILSNNSVSHFGKMTSKQLNTGKLYSDSRKKFIESWGK